MSRQPLVIAYDIESDCTRRRVHRILQEWRLDGQKSVHECRLTRPEAEELFLQLAAAIDLSRDRLLLAWLAPRRSAAARGLGRVDAFSRSLRHID